MEGTPALLSKQVLDLAQGFCELARIPSVIESYVPDLKIDQCGHKEETTLFSQGNRAALSGCAVGAFCNSTCLLCCPWGELMNH